MAPSSLKACLLALALTAAVAAADRRGDRGDRHDSHDDRGDDRDDHRPPRLVPYITPAATDVLVIRYGWAPIFCFAGSANATPEQFCGKTPPARTRFRAIRAFRIYYATATENLDSCPDPTAGYVDALLDRKVKRALSCIDNSYNLPNNDAEWNAYVWNLVGTCVAQYTGMDAAYYHKLIVDIFERYNPDLALKKAGIDTATAQTYNQTAALDILESAWGFRGFTTCDSATKSYLSTLSICLTTTYPFNITACPAKLLRSGRDCALPLKLEVPLPSTSIPVPEECEKYYPATRWPHEDDDDEHDDGRR